jgi:tellurium resistance protein TerZ
LSKASPEVNEISFVVTIHHADTRRQNFGQIRNSFIRILDQSNVEIVKYELDEDFSIETAVEFGRLYKRNSEWKFEAVGIGMKGGLQDYLNKYKLFKNMAITLAKGQKIDLRKSSGETLTNFCVGVNWGAIETKAFFGLSKNVKNIDLDLSCILIDDQNKLCDHLYSPLYRIEVLQQFGLPKGKLLSSDGALKHTGDDLAGDTGGDDGLDNEIITVDLSRVDAKVSQIFFFLNNAGNEDFSQIPYAKIRMYEGTPTRVVSEFASYNVSADSQYVNKRSIIMGKLYKRNNEWKFSAIGDPTEDTFLGQTIHKIVKSYL